MPQSSSTTSSAANAASANAATDTSDQVTQTAAELEAAAQEQALAAAIATATQPADLANNLSAIPHPAASVMNVALITPSYLSYTDIRRLQRITVDQTAYVRPSVTVSNMPAGYVARSDPLGIYQSQDAIPSGYTSSYVNVSDESGRRTFCYLNRMGTCASCMCVSGNNRRYFNDSFIAFCLSGEVWGTVPEEPRSVQEEDNSNWLSNIKQHIFFGSSFYERTNFLTASYCILDTEMVGIPFGAKSLRVGVGLPKIWELSSYFEDGGGKYVNFFNQKHHAGLIYQASSPTLDIQGTTKNGVISLSTSNKDESRVTAAAQVALAIASFAIPPLWRKAFQSYIHKKRRADITLACSTITMRVGDFSQDTALEQLERKHAKYLNRIDWVDTKWRFIPHFVHVVWRYSLGQVYIWCKARQGSIDKVLMQIETIKKEKQTASPSLALLGALKPRKEDKKFKGRDSAIELSVPNKQMEEKTPGEFFMRGSRLSLAAHHGTLGSHADGPEIFSDTQNQSIRVVVGKENAKLSVIDMKGQGNRAGISMKILADKPASEEGAGRFKNILTKDLMSLFSGVFLDVEGIRLIADTVGEGTEEDGTHLMGLSKKSLRIASNKKITLKTTGPITIKASKVDMKAPVATLNGSTLRALS